CQLERRAHANPRRKRFLRITKQHTIASWGNASTIAALFFSSEALRFLPEGEYGPFSLVPISARALGYVGGLPIDNRRSHNFKECLMQATGNTITSVVIICISAPLFCYWLLWLVRQIGSGRLDE